MWTGGGGQAPCGRPHRKLKLESTDVNRAVCISCRPRVEGRGLAHVDGGGGQKPDFFVDVIKGWPLRLVAEVS